MLFKACLLIAAYNTYRVRLIKVCYYNHPRAKVTSHKKRYTSEC